MSTPAAMTPPPAGSSSPTAFRLWPAVVAATLLVALRFVLPVLFPDGVMPMIGLLGGMVVGLLVVVWWAFFSRAPRWDRFVGAGLLVLLLVATRSIVHVSIATAAQGMLYFMLAVPTLALVFVGWALLCRGLPERPRRASMVAAILMAAGSLALVRTYGISGATWEYGWRWAQSPEERLLAQVANEPVAAPLAPERAAAGAEASGEANVEAGAQAASSTGEASASSTGSPVDHQPLADSDTTIAEVIPETPDATLAAAEWAGFRGSDRDGIVRGGRIATDWTASPPVELWRRAIGPGWSSFAVHGEHVYTQEQRGEDELVSCYAKSTGEPVWQHRDPVRFWEAMAGAGPRATPTWSGGRIYSLGATGILNALDAEDGTALWSRDLSKEVEVTIPFWGLSGSPLVVDDLVVVAVSGRLAAYDAGNGEPRWIGPPGNESYSSPHLVRIGGTPQLVLANGRAVTGVAIADGSLLWEHTWPGFHSLQPALVAEGDFLVANSGSMGGFGTRRLAIAGADGAWTAQERWTSNGLKPYFNDLVVHEGHAYGFDGRILACIDLESGERRWKGGRYGNGQLLLLAEQDLLLVLTEQGEIALVSAAPEAFTELARRPALAGKTWNHPALVGDVLLVRNDREMAAFRLPSASAGTAAAAAGE